MPSLCGSNNFSPACPGFWYKSSAGKLEIYLSSDSCQTAEHPKSNGFKSSGVTPSTSFAPTKFILRTGSLSISALAMHSLIDCVDREGWENICSFNKSIDTLGCPCMDGIFLCYSSQWSLLLLWWCFDAIWISKHLIYTHQDQVRFSNAISKYICVTYSFKITNWLCWYGRLELL